MRGLNTFTMAPTQSLVSNIALFYLLAPCKCQTLYACMHARSCDKNKTSQDPILKSVKFSRSTWVQKASTNDMKSDILGPTKVSCSNFIETMAHSLV